STCSNSHRTRSTTHWGCCSSTRTTSRGCMAVKLRGCWSRSSPWPPLPQPEEGPMAPPSAKATKAEPGGSLLANLMHSARTLRAAGLPVGPGKVIDAVGAVRTIGITDRSDFYWTLHAVFVNRPDQRLIFDQAFHVFWRNPDLLKKMMGLVLPQLRIEGEEDPGAAM